MNSSRETEFEARLARVEQSIAALQRSVDALLAERSAPATTASQPGLGGARRDPLAEQVHEGRRSGFAQPSVGQRRRANMADEFAANFSGWFSSKSPEWWLSRLGIGF